MHIVRSGHEESGAEVTKNTHARFLPYFIQTNLIFFQDIYYSTVLLL